MRKIVRLAAKSQIRPFITSLVAAIEEICLSCAGIVQRAGSMARQTSILKAPLEGLGWTPMPTRGPHLDVLKLQYNAPTSVCGYFQTDAGKV